MFSRIACYLCRINKIYIWYRLLRWKNVSTKRIRRVTGARVFLLSSFANTNFGCDKVLRFDLQLINREV